MNKFNQNDLIKKREAGEENINPIGFERKEGREKGIGKEEGGRKENTNRK